jgi:prepilin-type N-terminal cleavage/methylation domain-containing protein
MKPQKYVQKIAGFTLIELVVTIGIAGILMGIAVPRFYAALPGIRLASAARQVVTDLQLARMTAISQRTNQVVAFDTATATYTFGNNFGNLNIRNLNQLYPGTTITIVTNGGPIFNSVGAANGSLITLSNNGVIAVVQVNTAGRIF